jgi:hypothetical protein
VIALDEPAEDATPAITAIKVRYKGRDLNARVIDSGNADVEVHPGDWAIIKVGQDLDLPALRIDTSYGVRLRRADLPPRQRLLEGHHPEHRLCRAADAERSRHCLTDGHPGRVGRWRAEPGRQARRHSDRPDAGRLPLLVHLPIRPEMFRKVPGVTQSADRTGQRPGAHEDETAREERTP